jgi:response regulator RpfG family c-di-GMP phosphodiesterase
MFLETDYEIHTTDNGKDALKLLETNDIDMVISDMRMPELDGYKLLSIIKEKYPNIIRIILSGYADEKPMFQALLHNIAKLYVFKPWNNDRFLVNVNQLFADENELNSSALNDKLKNLDSSCVVSEACCKMFELIEEENLDDLIASIEQNPEISKLLLDTAKSGVYGAMPDKVKQAAIYIGLHSLKSFLRFACVITSLEPGNETDLLFKHSCLTNRIFLFLFEVLLHKQPAESAMFAGLTHNIGLLILRKSCAKDDKEARADLTVKDLVQLEYGEEESLHQELGAHFIDLWDLPFPIYETALYHHRPLNANIINRELVACVHIAQAYAWRALGAEEITVASEVFEEIKVSRSDFEKRLSRYLK